MKRLFIALLCLITLLSTVACSEKHTHTWKNYLIKTPTCTQQGLLERLCENCGEKAYESIETSAHDYQDGACSVCGIIGSSNTSLTHFPLPNDSNNEARWSMYKIYETATSTKIFKGTYDEFLIEFSSGKMEEIYINNLGLIHFIASGIDNNNKRVEAPLSFVIGKVSPKNPEEIKYGTIQSAEFNNNELFLIYNDGVRISTGTFNPTSKIYITGFGINENYEFVVYYSDNTIAFAGTILQGSATTNQPKYIYQEYQNGYSIFVSHETSAEIIKIPVSHRGKPVLRIEGFAFSDCIAHSIVIPSTITSIDPNAFQGISTSTKLYFEIERSQSPLPTSLYGVYYKGEWSYVNDIPTPKK